MISLARLCILVRRARAARRFGINFYGVKYLSLPKKVIVDGTEIFLSFPEDPPLAYEMVSLWLDDEYGLSKIDNLPRKVIDVGANVGLFTLHVKNRFPEALVHAYEPNPDSALHFSENVKRLSKVELHREGVSNKSGFADLILGDSSRLARTIPISGGSGDIKLTGLDEVVERIGGDIDLLKLDCEGAEWDILSNRTAIREVAKIRMEYHLWVGKTVSDLRSIANYIGFEITFLSQNKDIGIAYLERR